MNDLTLLFGPHGWTKLLLEGLLVTLSLALTSAPFGYAGGLLIAVIRRAAPRPLAALASAFTNFFRGIPDLLSLFLIYFGLQALLNVVAAQLGPDWHVEMNAFAAGALSLAIISAAYSSEIWLAALAAVPPGQREAAKALGLSKRAAFRLVTLPQLLRIALPGLGNLWLALLKDTSLISVIAVADLLRVASEASRATQRPILFYGAAALLYLLLALVSGVAQTLLERRYNRGFA